MCVDSAGVIYGLFSAPAVLTNELQAARWHAADNAARLLLQVSRRPSPRLAPLTHSPQLQASLKASHPSVALLLTPLFKTKGKKKKNATY